MKRISIVSLSLTASIMAVLAEDTVPYGYRPWGPADPFVPSLGDIMSATQLRHFKIWYAGKLGNWELASYELGQIKDSFSNAARLYQNIPIENVTVI